MSFPKLKLPPPQGEEVFNAKLTEEEVLEMRRLYWVRGLCMCCIAILHRVNYATATDAIKGRTWRYLPMPAQARTPTGRKALRGSHRPNRQQPMPTGYKKKRQSKKCSDSTLSR